MAKLTMKETPAQAPAAEAADSDIVNDSKGRRLKIKQPDILKESRLVRVMGEASMNAAYMTGYVLPAAMVVEIDGEAVPFPSSEREVEACMQRLGREGMTAVMEHMSAQAEKAGQAKGAVKN